MSVSATVTIPAQTTPTYDQIHQESETISAAGPAVNMEPSTALGSLGILPPELLFRILDFMPPHRYSGLSCTCHRALALVNRKLIVGEYCVTSLTDWKSATAPYVNMQSLTIPPSEVIYPWNVAVCYGRLDEDDDDL